ncbi:hypothetical protein CLV81_1698 [Flagellimonas meridianipacifica]|uniref:Uncharacterized protein n=1 Tax=Flagellimonas meridianipacifica TaxID=1080225 RepID=A0A2T0MJC3_9FLAO|nr:hypothetical protein CLV81_1698 [Allomuricauda pacifica]
MRSLNSFKSFLKNVTDSRIDFKWFKNLNRTMNLEEPKLYQNAQTFILT